MKGNKRWLFFIPVLCGLLLLFIMVSKKKEPPRPEVSERIRTVSVVEARKMTIVPSITGYGYVKATETWEAIPEVSGKVVEMHPELKKGTFVAKGELLIKIDPQIYGLAATRGQASVMSVEAQLKELEQEKSNIERLLEIEQQSLKLTIQEVNRYRQLYEKGIISISEVEKEEQTLLAQQMTIKNLLNTLDLIPSQEKTLLAQKESNVSSLSELKLDVEKTVIRAPFDCRISEVHVELDQYASLGKTLLKAVNISAVEIPVQLSPIEFVNLLPPTINEDNILVKRPDMESIRKMIGVLATVRLPLFNKEAVWEGKFMRTSDSIDLDTGAMTVYVVVQKPYDKVVPSIRPPLVPNLYCEVELQGRPRENRFVIPVQAVHDGSVYLVGKDMRLQRQPVVVEMVMKDMVVIVEGIPDGAKVVTTDLVPAIEGMLLKPVVSAELTRKIDALEQRK